MINETVTTKRGRPASTSDRWHVVHAVWTGAKGVRPFAQTIVSEHETREAAEAEAAARRKSVEGAMGARSPGERDRFIVRPPRFRSVKLRRKAE